MTGFTNPARGPHLEYDPVVETYVGIDPRGKRAPEMAELGLEPASPMKAIRAKCLDCAGDSESEVRRCGDVTCALWPFRMAYNPFRAEMDEGRKAALGERSRARHAARRAEMQPVAPGTDDDTL